MTGAARRAADPATSNRPLRGRAADLAALGLTVALAVAACGPSPSPSASPSPSPSPSPPTADRVSTLRFALAADPTSFVPPARDADTGRLQGFLYDSLYRLDDALRPVPVLAAELPSVAKDGRTWRIPIREGVTFSDGSPLEPVDVATTLRLARARTCPFGPACRLAESHLQAVKVDGQAVVLTLDRPWSPFLATLLADLPILPADAMDASLGRLENGARAVDRATLADAVRRIEGAVNAAECDVEPAPTGCSTSDHVDELAEWLRAAGAVAPRPERFTDATGEVDRAALGSALLASVRALSAVLGQPNAPATPQPAPGAEPAAIERLATALPLLDLARAPIGTGPYRLESYSPGGSVILQRRDVPATGVPAAGVPQRIEGLVLRDPAEAATALQSGRIDWLPSVAPEMVPVLESDPALTVRARPSGAERVLVFNVRDGHPYADVAARQAFAACLDRDALVAATLEERGLPAASLVAPASWASWSPRRSGGDPKAARAMLEEAGYTAGSGGIYARDGSRLATEVILRPGRAELSALLDDVAEALAACGIELDVREVPFSPDVILPLLEWPNAFDTYLATTGLDVDPGIDLGWLAGDRATSEANPGDANFGGWRDKRTDELLAAGEATLDQAQRETIYRDLQQRLTELVPAWPLVHEPAYAAVSGDLLIGDEAVDPSMPGYERRVPEWRLTVP